MRLVISLSSLAIRFAATGLVPETVGPIAFTKWGIGLIGRFMLWSAIWIPFATAAISALSLATSSLWPLLLAATLYLSRIHYTFMHFFSAKLSFPHSTPLSPSPYESKFVNTHQI